MSIWAGGVLALRRRDFAVVSGDGKPPELRRCQDFLTLMNVFHCLLEKCAEETQRESHQRRNLERTQKSSLCGENVCPGKLLFCMLGATFVAGRSHQSASNEDVQKLPYFTISSSQDGFLWFEALTPHALSRLRWWDPAASPPTPRDGPWPSPARRFAGGGVFHLCASVHRGSAAAETRALIFHSEGKTNWF